MLHIPCLPDPLMESEFHPHLIYGEDGFVRAYHDAFLPQQKEGYPISCHITDGKKVSRAAVARETKNGWAVFFETNGQRQLAFLAATHGEAWLRTVEAAGRAGGRAGQAYLELAAQMAENYRHIAVFNARKDILRDPVYNQFWLQEIDRYRNIAILRVLYAAAGDAPERLFLRSADHTLQVGEITLPPDAEAPDFTPVLESFMAVISWLSAHEKLAFAKRLSELLSSFYTGSGSPLPFTAAPRLHPFPSSYTGPHA